MHVEHIPARPGRTVPWPSWADPGVVTAYGALGVELPWGHQVEGADALWNQRHTVIATGTGSGKSLAAWLPALSALGAAERDGSNRIADLRRRPSTLYLSPTKALAADQCSALERLVTAPGAPRARLSTCDGDTPLEERDWVRSHADLVLTNPDFLHFSLLPAHRRWQRLLRALRFLVIDECHAYRGVLGAHVALVLRRLLRIARHYGSEPTVLLASATTSSPALAAARMIGVREDQMTAVTRDDSPAGRRTFALWEPPLAAEGNDTKASAPEEPGRDTDGSPPGASAPQRSPLAETAELLADLVASGTRTLAFLRARTAVEAVSERTRERLARIDEGLPAAVAGYRGGYLPEERRALEQAIRTGELLGLATTNALELGIDLSGLDAVLIAGWPGSRASLWQQAGRSGRAGSDGLAVLVAGDDPLERYLVHHPEAIFGAPIEATAFDPQNPYVLAPHLCAAAAELPIREEHLADFGLTDSALPQELVRRGLLRRRDQGWYWNHYRSENPVSLTDLRGAGGERTVAIVERGTGRVLGTVDRARADATVHEGAVYVHQGRTYVVDEYRDDVALAREEAPAGYRTRARSNSSVTILESTQELDWGDVRWGFGTIEVTSRVSAFTRLRLPRMEPIGIFPLDLPERRLRTKAVWYTVSPAALARIGMPDSELPGALHAAEHAAIGLLPLIATCDRWDIGGLSTALHEQTLSPTVFVYDGYPGGAGFAERGFAAAGAWLAATRAAIAHCRCAEGCPACIQSPKCGNGNHPLDKAGAVQLLELVLGLEPGAAQQQGRGSAPLHAPVHAPRNTRSLERQPVALRTHP